jgi:hypothetical protein
MKNYTLYTPEEQELINSNLKGIIPTFNIELKDFIPCVYSFIENTKKNLSTEASNEGMISNLNKIEEKMDALCANALKANIAAHNTDFTQNFTTLSTQFNEFSTDFVCQVINHCLGEWREKGIWTSNVTLGEGSINTINSSTSTLLGAEKLKIAKSKLNNIIFATILKVESTKEQASNELEEVKLIEAIASAMPRRGTTPTFDAIITNSTEALKNLLKIQNLKEKNELIGILNEVVQDPQEHSNYINNDVKLKYVYDENLQGNDEKVNFILNGVETDIDKNPGWQNFYTKHSKVVDALNVMNNFLESLNKGFTNKVNEIVEFVKKKRHIFTHGNPPPQKNDEDGIEL